MASGATDYRSFYPRFRVPPAPLVLLVFTLLLLPLGSAEAEDDSECRPQFRSMKAADLEGCEFEFVEFDTRLFVGVSARVSLDEDMYRTYGALPGLNAGFSVDMNPRTRFVMELGYESSSGNPHYDIVGFDGGENTRVTSIPLGVGFRTNPSHNPRFGVLLGFDFMSGWIHEKVPSTSPGGYDESSGWGIGYRISISPEWRSRDLQSEWGIRFSFGGMNRQAGHQVVGMGLGAQFFASIVL